MLNVLWHSHYDLSPAGSIDPNMFSHLPALRFDLLLSIKAGLTWIKLFLMFEFTPQFGPLIKIMYVMIVNLSKFLIIWSIQLSSFASVAILAFGNIKTFATFADSLIYFFGAALGNWDFDIFLEPDGTRGLTHLIGSLYQSIYLILNLVLMLNLVIAILSETFSTMSRVSNGLYCDTLVR